MRSKSCDSKRESTSSGIHFFRISYAEISNYLCTFFKSPMQNFKITYALFSNALLLTFKFKKLTNRKIFNIINVVKKIKISVDKRKQQKEKKNY